MPTSFSLCRSEIDGYVNSSFIDRIVSRIGNRHHYSSLTALFTPTDAPRKAILNRCREQSNRSDDTTDLRKLYWIPPFISWEMSTIGNLSLALLWHIYRSLPQEVLSEEKIIYKILPGGKVIENF